MAVSACPDQGACLPTRAMNGSVFDRSYFGYEYRLHVCDPLPGQRLRLLVQPPDFWSQRHRPSGRKELAAVVGPPLVNVSL